MSTPPALTEPIARTPPAGLTSSEVAQRRVAGLANEGGEHTSRPVSEILRANILTRFNFILGVLLGVILVVGQPQDGLFGIVLVANALIGIGLFPVLVVRRFYALDLPATRLSVTLLIAALGVAALAGFWVLSRQWVGRSPGAQPRGGS
jgi:hypothetical protein